MTRKIRMLVVEDEMTLRLGIRMQLENIEVPDSTIEVIDRQNLVAAKQDVETGPRFDVAIIDLRLGGQSGIDNDAGFKAIELLQEQSPPVPVVILSARNDFEAKERAKTLTNVRFFLTKNWASVALQQAVVSCLSGDIHEMRFIGNFEESDSCE